MAAEKKPETSLSVTWSKSGVKAAARSRAVDALDRLIENVADIVNVPLERKNARDRAIAGAEQKMIEQALNTCLDQIGRDPDEAVRILSRTFQTGFIRYDNKKAAVAKAIEFIGDQPLSDEELAGPEKLDPEFLNRFERYAEDASSDIAREKWGRVLSAEIRRPGTCSPRVLRLIDEIDPEIAIGFEKFCENEIGGVIPLCLIETPLSYNEMTALIEAGLLVDAGASNHIRRSIEVPYAGGMTYLIGFGKFAIGIRSHVWPEQVMFKKEMPLVSDGSKPAVPIHILTSAGALIAQILPNRQVVNFNRLTDALAKDVPDIPFDLFQWDEPTLSYQPLPPGASF